MKTESKKSNIQQNKNIAEKQTIIEKPTESELSEVEPLTIENDELNENSITEISDSENSKNESNLINEVEPEPEEITESDTKPEQIKELESDSITESDEKQITEKIELSAKQKIKALQKDIEYKKLLLEKEEIKVRDWRTQAKVRDDKNEKMLEKKKKEAEELIKTAQARYEKLKAGTKKWWWDYSTNHENKKIQQIKDAIATREKAIFLLQEQETAPAES